MYLKIERLDESLAIRSTSLYEGKTIHYTFGETSLDIDVGELLLTFEAIPTARARFFVMNEIGRTIDHFNWIP
ncbi:MAG TPA: hypothetical protein VIH69_06185 [Dehalococcoidia bacterium]